MEKVKANEDETKSKKDIKNKKDIKYITTYWMDLLTYIIIPLVTIIAVARVVKGLLYNSFNWEFLAFLIAELVFIALYILTFINSHKRTKAAYMFFRILVVATALKAAVDFAITEVTEYGVFVSLLIYIAVSALLWVYPNEIYFKNRKELFKNENIIKFGKSKSEI